MRKDSIMLSAAATGLIAITAGLAAFITYGLTQL